MKNFLINGAMLIMLLAVFQGISAGIGHLTMDSVQGWYQTLDKSVLTPPGWVFGAVWSALYGLLALSLWLVWRAREEFVIAPAVMLFGLHMLLNWSWSFVFFEYHMLALSFFWILAVLAMAAALFFIFRDISPAAAYLLIPYIGWLCFAAYLCFYIWQNNAPDEPPPPLEPGTY